MRLHWDDLPADTRNAAAARTGAIYGASSSEQGLNSEIAVILETRAGRVFVKGLHIDHPRVWTQQREAAINVHVAPLAPRLLWSLSDDQWHLLGFEYLDGRPADYAPGTNDLALVAETITALSAVRAPVDIELKQIEQRLADYVDTPADTELLRGDTLLHTDWKPDNVLIVNNAARVVDWAWPTRGAAWIDAACWVVWLVSAGHSPAEAEQWAGKTPAWYTAPPRAVDVFAQAQQRLWHSIADGAPDTPWKQSLAQAAHSWATHRQG